MADADGPQVKLQVKLMSKLTIEVALTLMSITKIDTVEQSFKMNLIIYLTTRNASEVKTKTGVFFPFLVGASLCSMLVAAR